MSGLKAYALLSEISAAAQGLRDALNTALAENVVLRCQLIVRERQLEIERERIEVVTAIARAAMEGGK